MTTTTKKPVLKNEITVEQGDKTQFLQGLDGKGDMVEGYFKGFKEIDFKNDKGVVKVPVLSVDGEDFLVPTNYELIQKLTKLHEIKNGLDTYVSIEVVGFTKLKDGKRVKNFKILSE